MAEHAPDEKSLKRLSFKVKFKHCLNTESKTVLLTFHLASAVATMVFSQ